MSDGRNPCQECELPACNNALDEYSRLGDTRGRTREEDITFYTLKYLLFEANEGRGAIGENNATTQNRIVDYINSLMQPNITVPEWQQSALQHLKDNNIVVTKVYPGQGRGTFIPCSKSDVKSAIIQLIDRIRRELEHLRKYVNHIE